jgi:acyl carrier protein
VEGDSLDHVESAMAIEETFNLELKIDSRKNEDSLK